MTMPSQPRVNQKWLKKCSMGNLNRFNQNRFRLKRLIPIEHDLSVLHFLSFLCFTFSFSLDLRRSLLGFRPILSAFGRRLLGKGT